MGNNNQSRTSLETESAAEFLSFMEEKIREALEPYRFQIRGVWKASDLRNEIMSIYSDCFRKMTLILPSDICIGGEAKGQKELEEFVADKSWELVTAIDGKIFNYFKENGRGLIFVIDFKIYALEVRFKLLACLEGIRNYKKIIIR
jgi:hypothetical protein